MFYSWLVTFYRIRCAGNDWACGVVTPSIKILMGSHPVNKLKPKKQNNYVAPPISTRIRDPCAECQLTGNIWKRPNLTHIHTHTHTPWEDDTDYMWNLTSRFSRNEKIIILLIDGISEKITRPTRRCLPCKWRQKQLNEHLHFKKLEFC